jgi:hypothetical protein
MIILGLDALDLSMVKKYNCKNLMQTECGQTDISEFKLARTVVLWASFLTGKNQEARIPVKTQWEFKLGVEETFFQHFQNYKALDVPAFSLKEKNHAEERRLLKAYFDEKATVEEYDAVVWKDHEENKKDFFSCLGKHDLFMAYFDLADAIGHLSFGIEEKMKEAYNDLENLAREVTASNDEVLVVSDHGMKAVGRYGDHSRNGFYSFNRKLGLKLPKITDFYNIVKGVA